MTRSSVSSRPQVLYTVSLVWWMRVLSVAFGAVLAPLLALPVVLGLIDGNARMAVPALIIFPGVLAVWMMLIIANLQRFTVDIDGITMRGWLGRRRVRWDEVAIIEVDRSFLGRGATVVVTRDGRRLRSELTSARSAIQRGESTVDHGPDLLQPAKPTRAAIEAHRAWLRGEFRSV